jgi:RimJ/RimL family protein N-acetyltransferase
MLCVGFRPLMLESERLLFRPGKAGDAERIVALLDWDILKYFDFIHYPYEIDAAERFLERIAKDHEGAQPGLFLLEDIQSGLLIGEAWVIPRVGAVGHAIGYWLSAGSQGKGYGRELVSRLIAYARDELKVPALHANVAPQNKRSGALLESLGFKIVGKEARPDSRAGNSYVQRWWLGL